MEGERISYHDSVRKVYDRIKEDGMPTIWDRFEAQGMGGNPDQRCPFCMGGVRCDLCSDGPCRADVWLTGDDEIGYKKEHLIRQKEGLILRGFTLRNRGNLVKIST